MSNKPLEAEISNLIKDARVEYVLALQDCSHKEAAKHHDYMLNKWMFNLINRKVIEELERLLKWDSFNEPYTWSGDERPYKIVRNRIAVLKGVDNGK